MSIVGQTVKGAVGLVANGLDFVITKSARGIENRFGDNELVKTVSEIGSSSVRITESTVKTFSDVVDGGIDAGVGYLAKDETKINSGLQRSKIAGKELLVGVKDGFIYTIAAGTKTTNSAVQAGKYYVQGHKELASREFGKTKVYAKHLGKVVVVGLLAIGSVENVDKDKRDK
jgi:hypothetical protein